MCRLEIIMKPTEDDFIILPEDTTGKIHVKLSQMKEILDDYEKARLCDDLVKILMNHCGEDGDNEGAVETLNRISEKARKWDEDEKRDVQTPKEDKKLRELIEKFIENYDFDPDDRGQQFKIMDELQKLLEESKK